MQVWGVIIVSFVFAPSVLVAALALAGPLLSCVRGN